MASRKKWVTLASIAEIIGTSPGAAFSELRRAMGKNGVEWRNGSRGKARVCRGAEDLGDLPAKFRNVRVTKKAESCLFRFLSTKDSRK